MKHYLNTCSNVDGEIMQEPVCKISKVHENAIKKVEESFPKEQSIIDLADTFKALSDGTRLKIVLALQQQELCVCDLSEFVGVSVSAISHQLRVLRNNRLVKFRKEGKMVYYSLDDEHVKRIILLAQDHVKELYR